VCEFVGGRATGAVQARMAAEGAGIPH
jgi:hypothetical protein